MSTPRNDGGPAFPRAAFTTELQSVGHDNLSEAGFTSTRQSGMTLRDYFAGQALAGTVIEDWKGYEATLAYRCYEVADAMLKAREASK